MKCEKNEDEHSSNTVHCNPPERHDKQTYWQIEVNSSDNTSYNDWKDEQTILDDCAAYQDKLPHMLSQSENMLNGYTRLMKIVLHLAELNRMARKPTNSAHIKQIGRQENSKNERLTNCWRWTFSNLPRPNWHHPLCSSQETRRTPILCRLLEADQQWRYQTRIWYCPLTNASTCYEMPGYFEHWMQIEDTGELKYPNTIETEPRLRLPADSSALHECLLDSNTTQAFQPARDILPTGVRGNMQCPI